MASYFKCPDCNFKFDRDHEDISGGYTCPLCENEELSWKITRLRHLVLIHRPTVPEHVEHHKSIQEILKFIDRELLGRR